MPTPRLGVRSPNRENVGREPDPRPQPLAAPRVDLGRPRRNGALMRLADHPRGREALAHTAKEMERWDINVTLLGQRKYMVNDCLGIKASAGQFAVKFGNSKFETFNDGAALIFAIDHIKLSALSVRVRPNPGNIVHPCRFSSRFEVSGSAKDIKVEVRFDPMIDLDECKLARLGDVDIKVRIGSLNLKPLPGTLDTVAKNMIEDSLTCWLEAQTPNQIAARVSSFPGGLCADKLFFYRRYMEQLSLGVEMYRLPQAYVEVLAPYYPNADLTKVRFGVSRRQPPGTGTTDCHKIYFRDRWFAEALSDGTYDLTAKDPNLREGLYHELRHVEQCAELGGRESYAERWFRDVEYAILLKLIQNPTDGPNVHDLMPMEDDANTRAQQVYEALSGGG